MKCAHFMWLTSVFLQNDDKIHWKSGFYEYTEMILWLGRADSHRTPILRAGLDWQVSLSIQIADVKMTKQAESDVIQGAGRFSRHLAKASSATDTIRYLKKILLIVVKSYARLNTTSLSNVYLRWRGRYDVTDTLYVTSLHTTMCAS